MGNCWKLQCKAAELEQVYADSGAQICPLLAEAVNIQASDTETAVMQQVTVSFMRPAGPCS